MFTYTTSLLGGSAVPVQSGYVTIVIPHIPTRGDLTMARTVRNPRIFYPDHPEVDRISQWNPNEIPMKSHELTISGGLWPIPLGRWAASVRAGGPDGRGDLWHQRPGKSGALAAGRAKPWRNNGSFVWEHHRKPMNNIYFYVFMWWISLFLFFGDHRYLNFSFLKRGIPQELGSRKVFGKCTKGSTGDVWQTNMNQPYGTCWVWFIGMITTYIIGYDMLIMHQQSIIFWKSCDEQYPKRKKMGRKMEETSKEHWKTLNTSRKPRHVDSAIPKAVLLHCSCRLLFFPRFFWIYVTACNDMFVKWCG